jgi:iron complex outermembrane receptor protein
VTPSASAQSATPDDSNNARETIVVTATRTAQPSFDLPASIDSIGQSAIEDGRLQINISESLAAVPGLVVQNRQNYAQDLQISSRGFGARTTFGIRGIRIYVDGIPATQPDGQGQVSNIDLGSAGRIEVLRGPFSSLYGNSAGGVISVLTQDGQLGAALDATVEYGSYGLERGAFKVSGEQDGVNYVADLADFHTGGYREHSGAARGTFNSKIRFTLDDISDLTLILNGVEVSAADPLGVTRAQFDADPRQAGTGADMFNTRKHVDQEQAGINYRRDLGDNDTLRAIAYGGNRAITQFQAIPLATQASAGSPGGVIGLAEGYEGVDIHLTDQRELAGMKFQVTAGVNYDALGEGRKGYLNFVGGALGVEGALRRNESDNVRDFDQYIQGQLEPVDRWLLEAGLRNSRVAFSSHDHYIVRGNGDDSGGVVYGATTPVVGVTYRLSPAVNLYASYGRGFQTPTLDELAYRSTNGSLTGLNFGLKPSLSDNYEVGVKSLLGSWGRLDAAAFHIDTANELAVQQNTAGRAVYQNVGRTRRDGVEIGFHGNWAHGFGAIASYTYLRAVYASPFTTCPALPCVPVTIAGGHRIPGVPADSLYTELSWKDSESGFGIALEGHAESRVYVNDPNSDAAPAYFAANLRLTHEGEFGGVILKEFLRVENLTDRAYAGSVIVNETSGRFFEPAPGRSFYAGVSARY